MKALNRSKHVFSLAVLLALALSVFSAPGVAWSSMRDDVRDFHSFLRDRPRMSSELRSNPNLVTNRRYMERNDDLARFLRRRPGLRQEIVYNPDRVFGRYYAYDRYDGRERYDRFGRWR